MMGFVIRETVQDDRPEISNGIRTYIMVAGQSMSTITL